MLTSRLRERSRDWMIAKCGETIFPVAYVPDLPGCVATGATIAESEIREAIRFHIDGLKADGAAVPAPTSIAEYVEA